MTQGNLPVEEYKREFKTLLIKCDIQELEEQTIVRYLGGLNHKYYNVVELQQCTMSDEVCVLAHKVEQQQRNKQVKRDFPKSPIHTSLFDKGIPNFSQDHTHKIRFPLCLKEPSLQHHHRLPRHDLSLV